MVKPDSEVLKARSMSRLRSDERLVHFFADNNNLGKVKVHDLEDYAASISRARRPDSRLRTACEEALEWFNTHVVIPEPPGSAAKQLSTGFHRCAQMLTDIVDNASVREPPAEQTPAPNDAAAPSTANDSSSRQLEDALKLLHDALQEQKTARDEAKRIEEVRAQQEAAQRDLDKEMVERIELMKEVQTLQVKAAQLEAELREVKARKEAKKRNGGQKMDRMEIEPEPVPVVVHDIQQQGPLDPM